MSEEKLVFGKVYLVKEYSTGYVSIKYCGRYKNTNKGFYISTFNSSNPFLDEEIHTNDTFNEKYKIEECLGNMKSYQLKFLGFIPYTKFYYELQSK